MNKLKAAGSVILVLTIFVAVVFVVGLLITGSAMIAYKVWPVLNAVINIATVLCMFVLLPLSLIPATRIVSVWGFALASCLFGFGVWVNGFLITFGLWGFTGILIGLVFGGVGVVPLGMISGALNGHWRLVGGLVYGVSLTFGTLALTYYLARKMDRAAERAVSSTTS